MQHESHIPEASVGALPEAYRGSCGCGGALRHRRLCGVWLGNVESAGGAFVLLSEAAFGRRPSAA
jgi:hypothetical protein